MDAHHFCKEQVTKYLIIFNFSFFSADFRQKTFQLILIRLSQICVGYALQYNSFHDLRIQKIPVSHFHIYLFISKQVVGGGRESQSSTLKANNRVLNGSSWNWNFKWIEVLRVYHLNFNSIRSLSDKIHFEHPKSWSFVSTRYRTNYLTNRTQICPRG